MAQTVTIYSPEGEERKETLLNARDLVLHCGFTYDPGKVYTPVDVLPAKIKRVKKDITGVQEVWENTGQRPGGGSIMRPELLHDKVEEPDHEAEHEAGE